MHQIAICLDLPRSPALAIENLVLSSGVILCFLCGHLAEVTKDWSLVEPQPVVELCCCLIHRYQALALHLIIEVVQQHVRGTIEFVDLSLAEIALGDDCILLTDLVNWPVRQPHVRLPCISS